MSPEGTSHLLRFEMLHAKRATLSARRFATLSGEVRTRVWGRWWAILERLFKRSPSLRRSLAGTLVEMYPHAVRKAVRETRMKPASFPAQLPYSVEQVLREEPSLPD